MARSLVVLEWLKSRLHRKDMVGIFETASVVSDVLNGKRPFTTATYSQAKPALSRFYRYILSVLNLARRIFTAAAFSAIPFRALGPS